MNIYLTQSKVSLIREAQQDLLDSYGINYIPFTRKIYFYFFILDKKKYVHKKSLRFFYSNAETYTKDIDPWYCKFPKETIPVDICYFLETYSGDFLPKLIEKNDKFLVYEYIEGNNLNSITIDDFYQLKNRHNEMMLTPFYNSMTYNLTKNENGVKLIDLKHFELKNNLPFFVYMYNQNNNINTLYIEENTDINTILKHLSGDYPINYINIINY